MKETHKYETALGTVIWQPKLCQHTGICVRGLGQVFNPRRVPWVDVSAAEAEQIRQQVSQCPSGALTWQEKA